MSNHRIVLAILSGALLAVFCWFAWSKRQPAIDNRTLSEWVSIYAGKNPQLASDADKERAAAAIRRLGTNAIPSLLAWLEYQPSYWRLKAPGVIQHLPPQVGRHPLVRKLLWNSEARQRAQNAPLGFAALGPLAAPALPELLRRMALTHSPWQRNGALQALSHLGPLALPILSGIAAHPEQTENVLAMGCIANLGTNALSLVPILLKNLEHTNAFAVEASLSVLADLQLDPEHVVPALTRSLQDSRYDVRFKVPYALIAYGSLAQTALPALTNALSDTNRFVRQSAALAIQRISEAPPTPARFQ